VLSVIVGYLNSDDAPVPMSAGKICDMLSTFDRLDKLVEPTPSCNKYSGPVGTQPQPDKNPYNAW